MYDAASKFCTRIHIVITCGQDSKPELSQERGCLIENCNLIREGDSKNMTEIISFPRRCALRVDCADGLATGAYGHDSGPLSSDLLHVMSKSL